MDWDDVKEILAVVLVITGIGALMMWGGVCISRATCASQWENSGFASKYSALGGCQISADGKLWIPAENYREIAE